MNNFYDFLSIGLFLVVLLFYYVGIQRAITATDGHESRRVSSSSTSAVTTTTVVATKKLRSLPPLQIFVLAGQSNTEGHGYVDLQNHTDHTYFEGTLEWLVESNPESFGKLKDPADPSAWKERDDVFVTYNQQGITHVRPEINKVGKLAPGFGNPNKKNRPEMGPELGFGWVVGDALQQDSDQESSFPSVLLLKTAWGGKSLGEDFRPPSSSVPKGAKGNVASTGLYYEAMMANIYKTLANLTELVPGHTHDRGYEFVGFAWHQGVRDSTTDIWTDEYESNMANFIRDVRIDLNAPDLLVTIGVTGMYGWPTEETDRKARLANAQFAVARQAEFVDTVTTVETRDFVRPESKSPGEEKWHWNNNCESYWLIGEAMGNAMVDLMVKNQKLPRKAAT